MDQLCIHPHTDGYQGFPTATGVVAGGNLAREVHPGHHGSGEMRQWPLEAHFMVGKAPDASLLAACEVGASLSRGEGVGKGKMDGAGIVYRGNGEGGLA